MRAQKNSFLDSGVRRDDKRDPSQAWNGRKTAFKESLASEVSFGTI
jgi:hypothetical protein